MTSVPVRYTSDVEDVKPDEAQTIEKLCETFDVILERTAEDGGHAVRSVHAKSHGILEGDPFNGKVFQAPTADAFLKNLKLLAKTTDRIESVKVAASTVLRGVNKALMAVGVESTTIGSLGVAPNVDPLGETFYSLTPFRYGDHIAKFSVKPIAPELTALTGREIEATGENPDAIRETVQREMAGIEGRWEFCVQLCRDLDKQPVEDPTVEWNEDETPFQRVGLITADAQDSWSAEKVQAVDEGMRFSVWTGLAAHRPLGNINRARNAPYQHSAGFRQRFNKCPIHEPITN